MKGGTHRVPTREATWRGMVMTPKVEMAAFGASGSWPSATVTPHAEAVQLGPLPMQTETAAPVTKEAQLDATALL